MEVSTEDRFSEAFDELIEDQGEGAFMIEESQNRWKITGYTLSRKGKMFKEEELRNAFLAQTMGNTKFEDKDRMVLTSYLEKSVLTEVPVLMI